MAVNGKQGCYVAGLDPEEDEELIMAPVVLPVSPVQEQSHVCHLPWSFCHATLVAHGRPVELQQCCAVQCCAVLCHSVPCSAILWCATLCHAAPAAHPARAKGWARLWLLPSGSCTSLPILVLPRLISHDPVPGASTTSGPGPCKQLSHVPCQLSAYNCRAMLSRGSCARQSGHSKPLPRAATGIWAEAVPASSPRHQNASAVPHHAWAPGEVPGMRCRTGLFQHIHR